MDEDVNLAAVRADDELLDAIGAPHMGVVNEPVPNQGPGKPVASEEELRRLLVGWRAEADTAPAPELVDTDTATRAVRAGRWPWRYRVMFRVLRWFRRAL